MISNVFALRQRLNDDSVDCMADGPVSKDVVWMISACDSKGHRLATVQRDSDGHTYCKLRNRGVLGRPGARGQRDYLRFNERYGIDVLGEGGPWNVFKVTHVRRTEPAGRVRHLFRFFYIAHGQYLCVDGANHITSAPESADGSINDGTLFELIGSAVKGFVHLMFADTDRERS